MYKFVRPYKKPNPNRQRQINKNQTVIFEHNQDQNENDSKEKEEEEEKSSSESRQSRKTQQQGANIPVETIKQPSHSAEKSNLRDRRESFVNIKRNKSLDLRSDSSTASTVTTFNEKSKNENVKSKSKGIKMFNIKIT
jgi:hypothetical protein